MGSEPVESTRLKVVAVLRLAAARYADVHSRGMPTESSEGNRAPLRAALDEAEPRPPDDDPDRGVKKNYAQRLSRGIAIVVADRLRERFPNVLPTRDEGHERAVSGAGGSKRLDVCVWNDPLVGLLLDVSIKTYSFRDYDGKKKRLGRMTKNVVRNDHELRAEAARIHERQPYAVLVGLMFVPYAASMDGKDGTSSFAHMVATFRGRSGRDEPDDHRYERFEAFYIGLYEHEGDLRGQVRFFDVRTDPPQTGRPRRQDTLSFDELVANMAGLVERRNSKVLKWGVAEGRGDDGASYVSETDETEPSS
jgi:hypothetical protein